MGLFKKSKLVVYLKPNKIEFYQKQGENRILDLPREVVSFQEIIDPQKFDEMFSELLDNLELETNKAILLLSEKILYEKIFPKDTEFGDIESFVLSVPFEQKSKIILSDDQEKLVMVANQQFIERIFNLLGKHEIKLEKVIPATLLSMPQSVPLDEESFETVTSENLAKEANFLQSGLVSEIPEKPIEKVAENNGEIGDEEGENESSGTGSKIILLIIILIILGTASVYLASTFGIIKLPFGKAEVSKSQSSAPSPSPVESSPIKVEEATDSAEVVKREDLKVQILNGTGLEGQATKIKAALETLGYINIETGNIEGVGPEETVVVFSKKVIKKSQDEILSELSKMFQTVSTQEATSEADFDIIITSGGLLTQQ